jgi:putative flippase GtrA
VAPARFVFVGVVNTLSGLAVIYLSKWLLGMSDAGSNALGYSCGVALSFVLNRNWTFRHSGAAPLALVKFLVVVGVAYAANLAVVMTSIHLGVNSYVAQALGVPIYTALTYWGSSRYAFASRADTG